MHGMSASAEPHDPQRDALQRLATPVQYLHGVGPQRSELLEHLGLFTARDVLFYFPRDYQDLADLAQLDQLVDNKLVRLRGRVVEVDQRYSMSGRFVLGALIEVGRGHVRAVWFNQLHMRDRLVFGQQILLVGKVRYKGSMWQLSHPHIQWLDDDGVEDDPSPLRSVYSVTEGLTSGSLRKVIRRAVTDYVDALDEVFPAEYLAAHELWPLRIALEQLHFPKDREHLALAQRRFIYQELFILQLALALRRHQQQQSAEAPLLAVSAKIDARIRRLFPFEFTPGQNQAIAEIAEDLQRKLPMNRLLQGDVGCGKTIVAVYAMLVAIAHGYQAVLMAPTEILARQHAATLGAVLSHSQVKWSCLTGSTSESERREMLDALAKGALSAVIGTQAVLSEAVQFHKLALVVIDEQHKFGVRQRATLRQAGAMPHYLVMTATPIPRSLALTLYGDLDVTTIRDTPPGRPLVHTYLATSEQRDRWWDFFARKLREGRQGYVIAPLVDPAAEEQEDEADTLASAEALYERLCNGPLEAFRVGMIHGRLSGAEQASAMESFRRGETQVLVATSIIEVGVDVPNATLMTIESAQRFGLSQLHQMRGRVSRGTYPGYCSLFAEGANEAALERLQAFVSTNDGFKLAELDLKLRGSGDILGTRQHGLPPLRVADLQRDLAVLEETRRDAQALVETDPGLAQERHAKLRRMVLTRYGQVLELGDVG